MRLIKIGRSPLSDIVINNEYVSANHATLLLMDNGDIFLTDCGSKQGTFVNDRRIQPNVEVPVKKGDKIDFYDVPLNWADIPSIRIPDPSVVKGVYGIGKASRNKFQLSGETVSRYHATFKEMKNGKWYITDHSMNGTFVNGQRIPSNQEVRISAKDVIICGSTPCPNPVPGNSWVKYLSIIGGSIAAVLLVAVMLWKIWSLFDTTDPYKATALVVNTFSVEVVFNDDPIKGIGAVTRWYLGKNGEKWTLVSDESDAYMFANSGTAFFVSENGLLLTNKHVVDYLWAGIHYGDDKDKQTIEKFRNDVAEARNQYSILMHYEFQGAYDTELERWCKSSFELKTHISNISVMYPGRTYSHTNQLDWAHLVAKADDDEVDLAVIRLDSGETPKDADWFRLNRALIDQSKLRLDENYYTVGYPLGLNGATFYSNSCEPTRGQLHLAKTPTRYQMMFKGDNAISGQSGSAVYDKRHRLVGVIWGGLDGISVTTVCPIRHAMNLIETAKEDNYVGSTFKSNNSY